MFPAQFITQAADTVIGLFAVEKSRKRNTPEGYGKMVDKYSPTELEKACETALSYTQSPSYKSVSNIIVASKDKVDSSSEDEKSTTPNNSKGITRGAGYYRRARS